MNSDKKIFDILPPQDIQKNKPQERKKGELVAEKTAYNQPDVYKKSGGSALKKIFFIFLIFLVVFIVASHFVLNKTEIKIFPKTQTVNSNDRVSVNSAKTEADIALKTIPGKIFEEEKVFVQEFPATGSSTEGKKAEGEITVYNNYSQSPQLLISNTRFISSGGKLFRTLSRVTVPGGTYVKGKFQPGTVSVKIIADQPGENYNIGPDTFSIPGFAGTAKYTSFYGKSAQNMTGGFIGETPQVKKDDLDNAKKTLTDRAKTEAKDLLLGAISNDFATPQDSILSEIISATSSALSGAKVQNFTYQVKVRTKIFAFRKNDLEELAKKTIISMAETGSKIKNGSLQISWKIDSVDYSGKMMISFNSSAVAYQDISRDDLVQNLRGKSLKEAEQILAHLQEIDRAQIKSWPFWAASIPWDNNKVEIEMVLD